MACTDGGGGEVADAEERPAPAPEKRRAGE